MGQTMPAVQAYWKRNAKPKSYLIDFLGRMGHLYFADSFKIHDEIHYLLKIYRIYLSQAHNLTVY